MENVDKFIEDCLIVVDVDKQREVVEKQSEEIQNQFDEILKRMSQHQ